MKMIMYKAPAILALSRGDALAIRLIMSTVLVLFARPALMLLGILNGRCAATYCQYPPKTPHYGAG
jgi:hypothetical protein